MLTRYRGLVFYLSGLPHEVRVESACTFAHVSAVTCFLQVDVARLKKTKTTHSH